MDSQDDIAIIGMTGRFPGARNVAEFWQNLRDGVESISFFPEEEMLAAGANLGLIRDPNWVNAGGVLDEVELFDASFFGLNPREAESMDPQQRLFMEGAWEALEDAGYDLERHPGVVGVFAGAAMSSYMFQLYRNPHFVSLVGYFQILIGNDKDYLATHTSYKLNLKGPSISIQTACSTSLVAVSLACQSLLNQQCDMALAGGINIRVPQKYGYYYIPTGIYSPDGHCKAFDAKAQGTVFGNGLGIVVLKRLADAHADGDFIRAIIKGTAINNDGSLKVGYTAPSLDGQVDVIAMAQAIADINPETITFIETHGTGTSLGDPIEVEALTQAFRVATDKKNFCAIGSVKSNIGHLDPAAGIASLIKTVLSLEHKMIPPSLHFETPNPEIDFSETPFYVNAKLSEWKTDKLPRRAGVSAFGIGGTNAHVILEEAAAIQSSESLRPSQLLFLSAKTSSALEAATTNLAAHLKENRNLNLADVAYTQQAGRRAFNFRRMLVCHDLDDAVSALETRDPGRVFTGVPSPVEKPVVFMFPGQGSQYVNMGLEIYRTEPTFRNHVDHCSELLKPRLGVDVRDVIYPSVDQTEWAALQLEQTAITQPALFVVEYALARLWMEWGVRPRAMIGHSIGEYVAACLAEVFTLEDALLLLAERGQLMQQLPSGSMLAVPLSEQDLRPLLNGKLNLAAINSPSLCVVSGPTEAIDQFETELARKDLSCRRLHTSHAFHSAMMDPILEPFTNAVKRVRLQPPQLPYISNLTGAWITPSVLMNPAYWANHLRQTVRFAQGVGPILREQDCILLEVGPGQTLSTFARWHPDKTAEHVVLSSLRNPLERKSDTEFILNTLGHLWLSGVQIDWSGFYGHERRNRIPLPTYPFERQRYWIEGAKPAAGEADETTPFKKPNISDWFYVPAWKQSILPNVHGATVAKQRCRWLVFENAGAVGSQIAGRLVQEAQDVIAVRAGERFASCGEHAYEINPREPGHYLSLLKELQTSGRFPERIAHLWAVTLNDLTESENELYERSQTLGFFSLMFLAQAVGELAHQEQLHLAVVSSNLHAVTGEERLCPEKATILGPCKVIPQEYPNIACRSIDLVIPNSENGARESVMASLIDELISDRSDAVVAYRGGQRWVKTFEPLRLEKSARNPPRLRKGGVYVITGGLGGMGLALGKYLAQTAQARLVLIGRSAFPERDKWEQWLADHDADDKVSCRIRDLQEIEQVGGELMVISADVANEEQMLAARDQACERFGHVHGVIHTAGIAGGGIIQFKTSEIAEKVLAPKVRGALVLRALFRDSKLDFLIFCSSLTSILGGVGQVDYCAANAFLDAFAHHKDHDEQFLTSINWDTWQEVGMAVNTAVPRDLELWRQEMLKLGMTSDEGVEVFTRILHTDLPQVVIATKDLRVIMQSAQVASREASPDDSSAKPSHPRPELGRPYVAPRNKAEQTIAELWQQLLGLEQVGVHDNFFTELGGHSLLATQVISRLRNIFQVELSQQRFFDTSTVAELAVAVEAMEKEGGGLKDRSIVPVRREQRRATLSAKGELQVPEELRKELSEQRFPGEDVAGD